MTFRLADSIPENTLLQWREERMLWLKAHGISDEIYEDERDLRYIAIPEKKRRHFERDEARQMHIELVRCLGCCLLRLKRNAAVLHEWSTEQDSNLKYFYPQSSRLDPT